MHHLLVAVPTSTNSDDNDNDNDNDDADMFRYRFVEDRNKPASLKQQHKQQWCCFGPTTTEAEPRRFRNDSDSDTILTF